MAQRRSYQPPKRSNQPPRPPIQVNMTKGSLPPPVLKVYGKPFIILENEQKKTFEFQGGAWVEYSRSIAECRTDCQVKELPQKVNKMTRYEIRMPE